MVGFLAKRLDMAHYTSLSGAMHILIVNVKYIALYEYTNGQICRSGVKLRRPSAFLSVVTSLPHRRVPFRIRVLPSLLPHI